MNQAIQSFNEVIDAYPTGAVAPASMLELGLLYAAQDRFEEALRTFDRLEQNFPGSEPALQAAYEMGVAYRSLGNMEKAQAQFFTVSEQYKGTLYGDKSVIDLGLLELAQGEFSKAIEAFSDVASRRTDEVGAEAQFRIGETFFTKQKYKDAMAAFVRVKYVYPASRDWIARSYLKLGECYQKISERGRAREAYQTVSRLHQDHEFGREATRKLKELR